MSSTALSVLSEDRAVNGETLRNSADLRNRVGLVPMGEEITLTTIRNGKRIEHKVKIGKARELASAKRDHAPQLAGSVVIEMDREHGLFGKVAGVVVAQSEPGSPAWRSGLRKGDVIIAVNQQPTPNLEAFGKAIERTAKVLAVNIIRDGTQLFLVLQ